jgi:hypothetical protein
MERNRWDTAIRCLEIAVHPNTSNEEIIAAINGFRRTADNAPLSQVCRELAGAGAAAPRAPTVPEAGKQTLDRLTRENLELRQKVEAIEDSRTAALRRLGEAEQRADEIGSELVAAEQRADVAEQRLAGFRGTYGQSAGASRHENFDLRHALADARRNLTQPLHEPVRPFQTVLNAALQRPEQIQATAPTSAARHPWTA